MRGLEAMIMYARGVLAERIYGRDSDEAVNYE